MEQNKPQTNQMPSYDKNNIDNCIFKFQRHILNYIDNIPQIKKSLLFLSLDGKTGNELMRSFSWKIYLNTLSSDKNTTLKTWLEETFNQRKNYKKKVKDILNISKFKGDPLGGLQASGESIGGWNDYFDKSDIKHLIKIDVDRTFQDRDLFLENSIKEMENNILYLFAKGNKPTYYRQGMNDILAMLIYSLYPYYTKSNIKKYTSELFDEWVKDPIKNAKDIYCFFHDENELQSDLYYLMVNIMKLGINKFYEDNDEKKNPGETKNYLVKRCEYLCEKKLKVQNNRLYHHFNNIELDFGIVLQRWIKCLFTREFHPQDCSVIWDAILANEVMEPSGELIYVDYFVIAMLDFISDELLKKDESECFKRLFHYPPMESMTTLLSLTNKIKPDVIELEKSEIKKEKEWKEKAEKTKEQLNQIAEQNQKLRKEYEENMAMNKQMQGNMNNFAFFNQMNLPLSPNPNAMFPNSNIMGQNMYLSPQFNQMANQQMFPKMNLVLNNNASKSSKQVVEVKENSPLDIIKNSYNVSNNEKQMLFNEIKSIMNKYKFNFNNEDKLKLSYIFEKLEKKI